MQDQSLIPKLLIQIGHGSDELRLKAAEHLWDVVAHQGCVGSSSVPTAEFLIELLAELTPPVQGENLDTLYQFSNYFRSEPWSVELRRVFFDALPLFERLSMSPDEDVSGFSRMIIENIEATK